MVASSAARVIRAPGRLVVNPSAPFSQPFPYGGVELGLISAAVLQPLGTSFRVEYESLGAVGDVLESGLRYVFSCLLRGWDDDVVQRFLMGGYVKGIETAHSIFTEPGNTTPGQSALSRGVRIVYVPDNTIQVPALVIYRGLPDWTEGAELAFQRRAELGIPLSIECLYDDDNRILSIGRIDDLSF